MCSMQARDKRILKLAERFLALLRNHPDRGEAQGALRIASELFVHPLLVAKRD